MTVYVYPRLGRALALARLEEVRRAYTQGIGAVTELALAEHPRAAPVATGGQVPTPDELWRIRSEVMDRVGPWLESGELLRGHAGDFDRTLGAALHELLQIIPADAAHEGPWSFLSIVLLPDILAARFPTMHEDRALGTGRNVLRRVWIREEILADLHHSGDPPLGEDELVGIFERSAVVRNRPLARYLAQAVLAHRDASARSEFARELYKRVRRTTGPLLLDALPDTQVAKLVDAVAGSITQGSP